MPIITNVYRDLGQLLRSWRDMKQLQFIFIFCCFKRFIVLGHSGMQFLWNFVHKYPSDNFLSPPQSSTYSPLLVEVCKTLSVLLFTFSYIPLLSPPMPSFLWWCLQQGGVSLWSYSWLHFWGSQRLLLVAASDDAFFLRDACTGSVTNLLKIYYWWHNIVEKSSLRKDWDKLCNHIIVICK